MARKAAGQARAALVQLAQVREEVLLRPEPVPVLPLLVVLALAPEERADVDEDVEDAGSPRGRTDSPAEPSTGRESASRSPAASTSKPEHQAAQLLEGLARAGRRAGRRRPERVEEEPPLARLARAPRLRVDDHEGVARADLDVRHDAHLAHVAAERGDDRGLHLHRLEDDERLSGLDRVARLDRHRHHDRRGRRRHQALRVAGERVGHALDLDEVGAALDEREHAAGRAAAQQAPLGGLEPPLAQGRAQPLDAHVDAVAVLLDPVAVDGGRGARRRA